MSPTARTLAELRRQGYLPAVVESWVPGANVRRDAWSILDVVAAKPGELLGVQTTSAANVAARVRKIISSPATPVLLAAGMRIVVHGWGRVEGRWRCRVVDILAGDCRPVAVERTPRRPRRKRLPTLFD